MIHRNAFCWCGSGKKWKKCHFPNEGASQFEQLRKRYWDAYQIVLKTTEQIEKIREAQKFAAFVVESLCEAAKEGVTTLALDELSQEMAKERGAFCASLNYGNPPYPFSLCTSKNEVICHGMPDKTPLVSGDIVNIDFGCVVDGYFGDCSKMVCIGEISQDKQRVVDCSYEALMESIAILRPNVLVSDIGKTIEKVAKKYNCSVVDQFVGHGVGIEYHENPQVPHCKNRLNIPLVEGMIFTIEPMINAGRKEAVIDPDDGWTARTIDLQPSAQWEHSILITKDGHEILTPWTR